MQFEENQTNLPKNIYTKLYPTESSAQFYGTGKINKLSTHVTIDDLPLRPIIFIVNTATYQLVCYLPKLSR